MKVIKDIKEMKEYINNLKKNYNSIGFVPTMGALHEGHLSLIRRARNENDIVIVSIFVNPLQFGPNEDYNKYPRTFDSDSYLCEKEKVDIIFAPDENKFYEKEHLTYVYVNELSNYLCGKSRPGHFQGVCTVVNKLFNIIKPTRAYFGKKDYQQLIIIKKMVEDLSMDIEIISCNIVRELDGLALSSRNKYLSDDERLEALNIYKSLKYAKDKILNGEKNSDIIKKDIENILKSGKKTKIDYIEIVDKYSLKPKVLIDKDTLIAIACFVGSTRLIDNILIEDFIN
ncbi:MAG: pantoate--beta-alanine ligase [Spirochaetes bacterium]|nr:pantoate--beta-alanine ligase [Spirochaetota bacterium]